MSYLVYPKTSTVINISVDGNFICRSINDYGAKTLMKTPEECLGAKLSAFFLPDFKTKIEQVIKYAFDMGKTTQEDFSLSNGESRKQFTFKFSPVKDRSGGISLVMIEGAESVDVDEVIAKAHEADLLRKMSATLGAVAHEVNNPLSVVIGYSEIMLLDTPTDDPNYEKIKAIKKHAERIKKLIIQMGDITQYKTKPYALDSEILDIGESSSKDAVRKKSVLIVDDQEDICRMFTALLQKAGYTVDFAFNGFQSIEMIKQNFYAIILMDMHMPGLDGFETLAEFQRIYNNKNIMFPATILISGHSMEDLHEKAPGINIFKTLSKPIASDTLIDSVKKAEEYYEKLVANGS